MANDPLVIVCSSCKRASCWQGDFYCDDWKAAHIEAIPRSELEKMELESADYWKEPNERRQV